MNKKLFQYIVTIPVTDEEFAHIDYIFSKSSLTDVQFARLWVKMNYNRVYDYFVNQRIEEKISLFKQLGKIRAKFMAQKCCFYSALSCLSNDELNLLQAFFCKEADTMVFKDVYSSTIQTACHHLDNIVLTNYKESWNDYIMYS